MIRTEAVNERKPIPTDYRALEEELERALFEEANKVESTHSTHDIREALRSAEKIAGNYQTTIQKYDASVIEAVSAGDTLEKTYVEMNKVRQDWLRSLEKLETILLYRIEPDAVEACNRARQAYLHASEELEKIQKQYDSERARDNDAYNKKKHEYELVLQRTRNRIENAPEYRARLQELVEQYSPSCALGREKVVSLGGLHVIGTERHEARRIDNQLRGRSGRQGDPGSSRFYVSLEDDVMRRFGGDRIKTVMNWVGVGDDIPIENKLVTSSLESAQVKVEGYHFDMRKHLVDYDDVVNTQRGIIYGDRRKSLEGADLKANILSMVKEEIRGIVTAHTGGEASPEEWTGLLTEVSAIIPLTGEFDAGSLTGLKPGEIEERLVKYAESLYEQLEKTLGADNMRMLERLLMLRVIDEHWVQHLTDMDHMRAGVGLQAVAQRDPLAVYKNEGHAMFQSMMESIRHKVALTIFHVNIQRQPPQKQSASPQSRPAVHPIPKQTTSPMAKVAAASRGNADVKQTAKVAGKKVGRNDPCPCGSGKKYKHCCGK
jgi:preprotein translocase subunit SecA